MSGFDHGGRVRDLTPQEVAEGVAQGRMLLVDIRDNTTGETMVWREVYRHEFKKAGAYQKFIVEFSLLNRVGHSMETRVDWHDKSYVRLDKVVVNLVE